VLGSAWPQRASCVVNFAGQRAVSDTAYHGYAGGDRIRGHRRDDEDGGRRSAEIVGHAKPDADTCRRIFIRAQR